MLRSVRVFEYTCDGAGCSEHVRTEIRSDAYGYQTIPVGIPDGWSYKPGTNAKTMLCYWCTLKTKGTITS